MDSNKKAASGAGNTTDSKANQSTKSVAQPSGEVKPYTQRQHTRQDGTKHSAEVRK